MLRLIQSLLACALLIFIAWVIQSYRNSFHEFDESNKRARAVSQMLGALIAYAAEHDADTSQYPSFLNKKYGEVVMTRYAWITTKVDPASSDIVLIERPELVEGEWCFAAFGDAYMKKVRRDQAAEIIRSAHAPVMTPTPSP